MKTYYYAVCNVNGPISVRIEAENLDDAITQFEREDSRSWIDDARTDAEDDLDISGDGMGENEFDNALRAAKCSPVKDLATVENYHAGTTAHLSGGWYLWQNK